MAISVFDENRQSGGIVMNKIKAISSYFTPKYERFGIELVDALSETRRGSGGFGSTGE